MVLSGMLNSSSSPLLKGELAARFSLSVIEILQFPATADRFEAAAQNAFLWADYCLDLLQQASPEPKPPVCQPGCNFCCYNQVELTAPEALLMGKYLADRLDAANLSTSVGAGGKVMQPAGRQDQNPVG